MAPTPPKPHLFLLQFTTLLLLVQSKPPTLLRSDLESLSLIIKDLGLPRLPAPHPCDSAGISCTAANTSSHTLRITALVFEDHHLNGRISPAISKLTELKQLSLPNNNLFDQIPSQITQCNNLEILDLKNNQLSGQIPPALSRLIRLRVLDLSGNMFAGNLKFLKHFPNLETLNLAHNMFSGTVPASLRSFRNLRFIDFSGNTLLQGPLPTTTTAGAAVESAGIPKRYSFAEISNATSLAPGPSPAGGPSGQPTGPKHNKNRKRRIIGWSIGFVAGVIGGILSGLVCSLVFKLLLLLITGGSKDTGIKIFSPLIKKPEDLAFLEKEDGLSSLNIIGRGGCGEVYKAVLPGSDGKEIAIKKINQSSTDQEELTEDDSKLLNKKMRQIRSEIKTVGEIRHRNLLPLLAHLPRPDCHYLVYEYMKNGSVHDYLLQVRRGERELDWPARYKIVMGIAAGLEYLHMNHTPRIIHR